MHCIEEQLSKSRTVAVVGLSPNPQRDSHRVAKYLKQQGYRIIPVNPMIDEVLGEKSYPDLKSVPEPIDMVDIFRRSELVPPVVEEALQVGAKYIWDAGRCRKRGGGGKGAGGRATCSDEQLNPPRAPPPVRWQDLGNPYYSYVRAWPRTTLRTHPAFFK